MRTNTSKIELFVALGLAFTSVTASAAKPLKHKAVPIARVASKPKTKAHGPKLLPAKRDVRNDHKAIAAKVSRHQQSKAAAARPAAAVSRPEPVVVPEEDSIQVTHDRKRHSTQGTSEPQAEPRKATSADFLEPSAKEESQVRVTTKPPTPELTPTRLTKELVKLEPGIPALLYTKRGKLIVPPALKGSHEILLHQNEMADRDGLDRIRDDEDLDQMREDKLLVPIPTSAMLVSDERLPANRRYTRPWTAQFLTALARAHYARFHSALQVNSAVRTVQFQQKLLLTNGNAAPARGETASPHLTGQAVDLAKHGLSLTEIAWLRGYLMPLVQAGKVDVEEEFQQACFHISVYKNYVPQPGPGREIAAKRGGSVAALATAIR